MAGHWSHSEAIVERSNGDGAESPVQGSSWRLWHSAFSVHQSLLRSCRYHCDTRMFGRRFMVPKRSPFTSDMSMPVKSYLLTRRVENASVGGMPNPAVAALITEALVSNRLVHPGDPSKGVQPRPIVLPIFRPDGQPKEVADLMSATAKFLGEAIVALIETEGGMSMVPTAELAEVRALAEPEAAGRRIVRMVCKCGAGDPLAVFAVDSRDVVVVDGKQLLSALAQRSPEHPHGRIDDGQ
jgi:hypothetical protein